MDGFEDWYRAEHGRVLVAVAVLSNDLETARDVTAEAFARALGRWDRVQAMANPTGWTYTVALNLLRRRRSRSLLLAALLSRSTPIPSSPIGFDGVRFDVMRAVQRLPARARTAVVLRYVADLTEAEVAEIMNVAPGTVAATLSNARRRLAVLLADYSSTEETPVVDLDALLRDLADEPLAPPAPLPELSGGCRRIDVGFVAYAPSPPPPPWSPWRCQHSQS